MIAVQLTAAVLSGLIDDLTDSVVILLIVALNAAIDLWQQWRADEALQTLKRMATRHATVRHNAGRVQVVETKGLVPGDVVLLEAGQLVLADLRLGMVTLHAAAAAPAGEVWVLFLAPLLGLPNRCCRCPSRGSVRSPTACPAWRWLPSRPSAVALTPVAAAGHGLPAAAATDLPHQRHGGGRPGPVFRRRRAGVHRRRSRKILALG